MHPKPPDTGSSSRLHAWLCRATTQYRIYDSALRPCDPRLWGPAASRRAANTASREALWRMVQATAYPPPSVKDAPMGNVRPALLALGRMRLDSGYKEGTVFKPFIARVDVRQDRQKLFHTCATTALANFEPERHTPCTGLLQSGSLCLVRLSLASTDDDYVPGLAVKFFVHGHPTRNIVALPRLDGQTQKNVKVDRDFFAHDATTWFPAAEGKEKIL